MGPDVSEQGEELTMEQMEQNKLKEFREQCKSEIKNLTKKAKKSKEILKEKIEVTNSTHNVVNETQSQIQQLVMQVKELSKEMKQKDQILETLGGNKILETKREEIKNLEDELQELNKAWLDQREELESELRKVKRAYENIKGDFQAKEEKIDFFGNNYSNLIANLKSEIENRSSLIEQYQNMPKDMTREQLSTMIFELKKKSKANSKTTQTKVEDLKVVRDQILKVEESLKVQNMGILAEMSNGENKKKKNDMTFDQMKLHFKKYCETYEKTKGFMKQYGELKKKVDGVEDEIMGLKKKNYKHASIRLREELKEISGE